MLDGYKREASCILVVFFGGCQREVTAGSGVHKTASVPGPRCRPLTFGSVQFLRVALLGIYLIFLRPFIQSSVHTRGLYWVLFSFFDHYVQNQYAVKVHFQ